jgi:L-lactate dehydrogenase complex protein LldG
MATSRDTILNRLRAAQQPFGMVESVAQHRPMVPLTDSSPDGLLTRFVDQAEKLGCQVYRPDTGFDAQQIILRIIGEDHTVQAWDAAYVPLPDFDQMLATNQIEVEPQSPAVRVGITGADAGLAATGSLVLTSGPGKPRAVSLLPPVHVAVLRQQDIMADLESWVAAQRNNGLETFRQTASAMIISGPSRTADIAMQLMMGMHGPAELHIVVLG